MKNCEDCIKNNRHPNAVGCLQCSVTKAWYDKLKEKKESKGNTKNEKQK